ncbi:FG-GAP-like repeat-containing protein [Actinosynnema sp. NPDC049800]
MSTSIGNRLTRWTAMTAAGVVVAGLLTSGSSQAVSGGNVVPDGSYQFLARISAAGKVCSGALIDPRWVVTSASCLPETGDVGVLVGAVDLGTGRGHRTKVVKVVRHAERDLAMVKLLTTPTNVTPIALSTGALAVGETVKVGGFGRTATEWVPNRPHVSSLTVSSLNTADAVLTGPADTCKGDAGGPAFREVGGVPQLVGVHRTSWQHGCLEVTETRQGSTETRADDLAGWFQARMLEVSATPAQRHAIHLNWTPRDYQSFRVYASQSADVPVGPSTLVGTVTTRSFTHTALAAEQTWYYRVVGVKDGQASESEVVSATTALPTRSDFDHDGDDDIAAVYDSGNDRTRVPVWPGGPAGIGLPEFKWDSGAGQFTASQARWVTGDFNGDGRADLGAFYNRSGGETALVVLYSNATGFDPWVEKWNSGPENWPAQSAKVVSGDFNGDGRVDIAAFYDLGGGVTRLYLWQAAATGFAPPVLKWDSGPGNFEQWRATFVTGDFNGDGRMDIGAAYDYGSGTTGLFVFHANATGFAPLAPQWNSGAGNFYGELARWVPGDFNGDGRADIAALYNYSGGSTSMFVFYANANGITPPVLKWSSGAGNFYAELARWVAGDFNGDGRADIATFYNYDGGVTRAFVWYGNATGFDPMVQQWDGGPQNWEAQGARIL